MSKVGLQNEAFTKMHKEIFMRKVTSSSIHSPERHYNESLEATIVFFEQEKKREEFRNELVS